MSDVTFYLFFLSFIYIFVYIYILIVLIYLIKYYTRKIKRWRHKSNWQSWFWCKCQHAFPCGWMWKGHSRDFMRLNVDQRNSTWLSHWTLGLRFGRQPLLFCKQIHSLTFDIRHRRQNERFFNHFFFHSVSNFFTFQSYLFLLWLKPLPFASSYYYYY